MAGIPSYQKIGLNEAQHFASEYYRLEGDCAALPGELDSNFRITCEGQDYILKISRPGFDPREMDFQQKILEWFGSHDINAPELITNVSGEYAAIIQDSHGQSRCIRLITWTDGKPWSSVNPVNDALRTSLGIKAAEVTQALTGFDHPHAHREFQWDNRQAAWVKSYFDVIDEEDREAAGYFLALFDNSREKLSDLRTSVIHNDVNDNNIIVEDGKVSGIIDYGDAIHTWTINDAAVALTYVMMDQYDPLGAARAFISGYHRIFPLEEKEMEALFLLVGLRLVISLTKSGINLQSEPENAYLQISRKSAKSLLHFWHRTSSSLVNYHLRPACGYPVSGDKQELERLLKENSCTVQELLPGLSQGSWVDMSCGSTFLGYWEEFSDQKQFEEYLAHFRKRNNTDLLMNGYGEARCFYSTESYRREGNAGPEYRTIHLGMDFWTEAGVPVHAPLDGKVFAIADNEGDKNYGPTVILEHALGGITCYSLYGHLSRECLGRLAAGDALEKGDLIGFIGDFQENGAWAPHLHFQLIHDMLDYTDDYPGVAYPAEAEIWLGLCPNPGLLFTDLPGSNVPHYENLLKRRKEILGRGMSVSYQNPLTIVRGHGAYLVDYTGRKYLDTVNNVAHVGHEHPRVAEAGRRQMAVLNTNTRYLHPAILDFSEELLATFPKELCVVHVVNSGSEANELALRMAYTVTGEQDMLAMEVGYHGNTTGTVAVSSYKFNGKGGNGAPDKTHVLPMPDSYRGIYRGTGTGSKYAAHTDLILDQLRELGRKPAGFIGESILSCGGQVVPPEGYMLQVYQKVREAGGICIADEVQTGCGRVGEHFWAFELHGVIPDIVTIGKPIGNGHPLGVVVCTREVADAFANGMEYFNTFGGNPVSSVIGTEVLRVIREERLQENSLETGGFLLDELMNLMSDFPCIGDVLGKGFFLGMEFCTPEKAPLPDHASYLVNRARELGILMSTDGPQHNVVKLKPPMVFSEVQAAEFILRIKQILKEDPMRL